jgi:hypothetical protein
MYGKLYTVCIFEKQEILKIRQPRLFAFWKKKKAQSRTARVIIQQDLSKL